MTCVQSLPAVLGVNPRLSYSLAAAGLVVRRRSTSNRPGGLEHCHDEPPAHPEPAVRRQHVQPTDATDVRRRIGVDVEPTDADDAISDPGDEERLARPVEAIRAGRPLVDEPPHEARALPLAVREEDVEGLGR